MDPHRDHDHGQRCQPGGALMRPGLPPTPPDGDRTGPVLDRRRLLTHAAGAPLGLAALNQLGLARGSLESPHFPARAKRIVYLFQSGGPSQFETFDYKVELDRRHGQELPESVRNGQRLTTMSGFQSTLPLTRSIFSFERHGECGTWVSELLPETAKIVDKLCFVRSMWTDAINHDPAMTLFQTGSQIAGRPSLGAWLAWGLGSENADLPAYVVLTTRGKGGQPLYARLWGSGFLPSRYQGVEFRAEADRVLFLNDTPGVGRETRGRMVAAMRDLATSARAAEDDPEIESRLAQAELAFRMQLSVPEVTATADEPEETFSLYGEDARKPGTYAANCLLARRLLERGVRNVQLYHQGWDQHGGLPGAIRTQCLETDRASAALVLDLERRGLLDDTLVVWGGEFGRTNYCQGALTESSYGRDHHPRCFTVWLAGAGIRGGTSLGETDEFGYNIVRDPYHVHDLHATLLHLMGIDHERLTYRHQGRRFRLTDVHGELIRPLLS